MHSAVRDGAKSSFVALRTWSLKQGPSNSMEKGREMDEKLSVLFAGIV